MPRRRSRPAPAEIKTPVKKPPKALPEVDSEDDDDDLLLDTDEDDDIEDLDDEDSDVIEDTSDLGGDDDDVNEVLEKADGERD